MYIYDNFSELILLLFHRVKSIYNDDDAEDIMDGVVKMNLAKMYRDISAREK